ncbi:MAG TPA: 1,4-dihydroxy-2-naphthoate octaprenyltransferase, partial [Gemmatimonadaceae bacterium]|nr:1,4-dihydroxy-2-naphthoate octaprenyltransferase [Gemmatimonadaceae bacterium]
YHGLGDVFVFVFFGLVAVTGTAFLQAGTWSSFALLLSIPIGLLVTNILVVNNLRDRPTDIAAGKKTLAVRIGDRATRMQYSMFAALAFIVPLSHVFGASFRPWLLLPWITMPFAIYLMAKVQALSGRDLNPILKKSGQLLLAYGVLLAIGAAMSAR